jgi:hypothetical protein
MLLFTAALSFSQTLKPGFDADEYIGVLHRCSQQVDKKYKLNLSKTMGFDKVYVSPEMGLKNKWELWVNKDKTVIVINLRGTTSDVSSLLENFYSAMIPAEGKLNIEAGKPFSYKFAGTPKASVHVGWAIGISCLIPDITEKVRLWYGKGVRQILIEGHSQGGALAFLLTSHIRYQMLDGKLPNDLVIKTYCSAGPKPGNLYYAYDYDFLTRGGWGFNVVNTADWVPEMPGTIQTLKDINDDPFGFTKRSMRKQNFIVRYYITHIYNQLNRATRKAQRKYEKYLGRKMYTQIAKYLVDLDQPEYTHSVNFAPAGTTIVLQPDSGYHRIFPDTGSNIFKHHLFEPYYYLVNKNYK